MTDIQTLVTENIDVWTSAVQTKSGVGRGNRKKLNLYGIKKLRKLILELAVRGKLVPQDENDEPASVLLGKIAAEKERLIKEKKIKKPKKLPEIGEDEKSFELPVGWEWVRLGEVVEFVNGYAFKSSDFSESGIGIVKIGNIQNGEISTDSMSRVQANVVAGLSINLKINTGDLLIAMSGATTGKLGFNRTDEYFFLNQRVGKICPFQIIPEYLYYPLTTKIAENLSKSMGSAIPNLSTIQINNIVFALPPIVEQHRIVAKVDELMALCDQLERQTEDSITAHKTLVETLLATLTSSKSAEDLTQNWNRISDHFDTLFTTEDSIDQLKQTILQLAVMGKLVSQDPDDKTASVLLEKIAIEKARLIKEKKIKKQKELPPIGDDEKPFDLPVGWEWAQCADVSKPETIITYGILKPVWVENGVPTVRIKDMINGQVALKDIVQCDPGRANKFIKTTLLENDLLIAKDGGTLGKTAFIPPELAGGNITQHVLRFSISNNMNRNFIRMFIDSPIGQNWMTGETKGVALPGVNVVDFRRMPMGIPSLQEQNKIVAKVEQLMQLCYKLKTRISDSQIVQLHLTECIVEEAVS